MAIAIIMRVLLKGTSKTTVAPENLVISQIRSKQELIFPLNGFNSLNI